MKAIGVFDSGVGGLTVLRALRERWPGENFIYLADTARLPYGSKSLDTIHLYAQQNIRFLQKHDLKAVVVACNSASTAILEKPLKFDLPVLNVVEPGARRAVATSTNGKIGVFGTRATVLSQAYVHAIQRLKPEAEVFQQPCPLLVPLVEEGWLDDPITNLIVYRYVQGIARHQVDTIILGCTHYPAVRASIQKAVGPAVQLVDSSSGVIEDLENLKLAVDSGDQGSIKILCTDFSPRLKETIDLLLGTQVSVETVNVNEA
jgi:glutamate racemase